MRLKQILIVTFVAVTALPVFAGLQLLNHRVKTEHRSYVETYLQSISLIAKQRVLASIDRINDNAALVASRTQMRESLDAWNNFGDPQHKARLERNLRDARRANTAIRAAGVYDKTGQLVAATEGLTKPKTLERVDLSDKPVLLRQSDGDVVIVSLKVLTFEDRTIGYLHMEFGTGFLSELVQSRTGLGQTGEWLIAARDENGDAVFAVPLKYDNSAAYRRRVAKDRLDVPITQALLGNEILMSEAPDYRGVPVLASTRYIRELDWGLVAKVDEVEVGALVQSNQNLIYLGEVLIVAFSIIVGIVLSIYIAAPLERLMRHTNRVAAGNLGETIEATGWHEVKELTDDFAAMVRSLKEINDNLNDTVEQRTRELQEANKRLQEIAIQDPLTGVFNRRQFEVRLDEEFARAVRYDHSLVVAIVDLDHFKSINDTYGHAVGDEVLKKVAGHMQGTLRQTDTVARVGGEEFCLILPETTATAALTFLERLREDIAALPITADGKPVSVTCSIGIAALAGDDRLAKDLMVKADKALYEAKENGRNRIIQFSREASIHVLGTSKRS